MSTLPNDDVTILPPLLNNTSEPPLDLCSDDHRLTYLVQLIVLTIFLPIHLFLCFSVILYRNKLRSNIVNIYAVNVLVGNLVSCLVRAINVYYLYFGATMEDSSELQKDRHYVLYIWLFLKSIELCMFLVISGGIGLLIMALRENLFRVHRTVAGMSRNSLPNILPTDKLKSHSSSNSKPVCYGLKKLIKRNPRRWAYFLSIMSWIIPVVIIGFIFSDRGCIKTCDCLLAPIKSNKSASECLVDEGCSSLWSPATNRTIILCFCMWIAYVIILLGLLIRSFVNFRQIIAERKYVMKMHIKDGMDDGVAGYSSNISRGNIDSFHGNDPGNDAMDSSSNSKYPNNKSEVQPEKPSTFSRRGRFRNVMSNSLLLESLRNNLCFILAVSIIFIVGTGLVAVLALLVSIDPNITFYVGQDAVLIPFFLSPPLSETINSILLCTSLLGIRSAAKSLCRAVLQCGCFKNK